MQVNTALHVHERLGSGDSRTAFGDMVDAYVAQLGTPLCLGVVGHDHHVSAKSMTLPDGVIVLDGIEHEVQTNPRVHISEYPSQDLSILAHPRLSWPSNTLADTRRAVGRYGVDAVEKYNAGRKQFDGDVGVPMVAGDDAHSPVGVGRSWMRVDADEFSKNAVVDAILKEDFEIVNHHPLARSLLHRFDKSALSLKAILSGDVPIRRFL